MVTEETVGAIVEAKWPGGQFKLHPPQDGYCSGYATSRTGHQTARDGGYWVDADAPTPKDMRMMLAAAILAPELMALVEAAKNVVESVRALGRCQPGSEKEGDQRAQLLVKLVHLGLAMDRLPEELTCQQSE